MTYGRYKIVDKLGEGSMGVLYQAYDPQIDRMVALKVLRQDRLCCEDFVQRFLKEAKAIGRLSHPNIVTVYDVGHDHENLYIAMELLKGKPLDLVIREGGLSLKEAVIFGIQAAEALNYAHQKAIVHRDIKPPNIIITPGGKVKITDFGIARFEDFAAVDQTRTRVILGTPLYMSPEQVSGQHVDGRSDLYSLGAVLYELTTGQCPFKGAGLAALFRSISQDTPEFPTREDSSLGQEQTQAFYNLIMKSLSKEPEERFQNGDAMAKALIACLREVESLESEQPSLKKTSNRFVYYVAGPLILTILMVGVALFFWPPPKQLLSVGTDPDGAHVFIDGSFQGTTPLKLKLPVGKHEVKLSLEHHFEWEAQIHLDKEKKESLLIPLVPMGEPFQ